MIVQVFSMKEQTVIGECGRAGKGRDGETELNRSCPLCGLLRRPDAARRPYQPSKLTDYRTIAIGMGAGLAVYSVP